MSLYRIDGHVMSVGELYQWVAHYVTLVHQNRIEKKAVPEKLYAQLEKLEGNEAAEAVLLYLKDNETFLDTILRAVREAATEMAMEIEPERKSAAKKKKSGK